MLRDSQYIHNAYGGSSRSGVERTGGASFVWPPSWVWARTSSYFSSPISACPTRHEGVDFRRFSGGIFNERTSSSVARADSSRGGVSGLPALCGCLRRANPKQGPDQAIPFHRQGGEECAVQEGYHQPVAAHAHGRHHNPRRFFPKG